MILCLILFAGQGVVEAKTDPVQKTDQSEQEKPEQEKKAKYVYNPTGKTDPFVSFLTKSGANAAGGTRLTGRDSELQEGGFIKPSGEPETELEKIEISLLTLTAVIKGEQKVWAMVTDTKGRGYFLEAGTKIGKNSGVVDKIICEEKVTDLGKETVRKVVIKIPYRNRDRQIIYRFIEMEMPYATL